MDEYGAFMLFVITFLSVFIFLLALVPVQGVVTRFRINYTPKGVGLGELGEEQRLSQDMRVGPVVNSVWEMFTRVRRIEGIQGYYKGFMPLLIVITINYIAGLIIIGSTSTRRTIDAGGWISSTFWALFLTLVSIPGEILVNRAVTTPHKLGWFTPRTSLRALFTPHERSHPWTLYLTPGLALAQTLHVLYFLLIARAARAILIPSYASSNFFLNTDEGNAQGFGGFWSWLGGAIYALFLIASVGVLSPLEVLSARLSVQRNHPGGASMMPVPTEESEGMLPGPPGNGAAHDETAGLEFAGAEEDVIALRNEDEPYGSLVDAYKKVVLEEGMGTLYRCWWLTLFATFGSGFA